MKKIISALILAALLLSSVLAIIPVAAEEETPEKINALMTSADDQMNGVGPAFYYNYHLFNFDIGKYPITKVPQADGTTKDYKGITAYMLRAVNAASGGATSIDGKFDTYAGTYHSFNSEGKDVTDADGNTYHFDSYLGISLKETTSVDSFTFYTLNEETQGGKALIEEITLFGARVNPETHTFDPNSWFKMCDTVIDVQGKYTEDGKFAVATGELYMPFDIDYVFMAFNCEGTSGGSYVVVEFELYEYTGGVEENIDFSDLTEAIASAEAELAKENAYTTNSRNALSKACDKAKNALNATNQKAVNYALSILYAAIGELAPLADTTELAAEIEKHASLEEATYTTSSWATFAAARDAATALIESGNGSETTVGESFAALVAAVNGLATKATAESLAALKEKFDEANALDPDKYTAQSFSAIRVAKRNANPLIKDEKKDDVSVEECEKATKAFVDALAGLKERADFSELQAVVDDALSVDHKLYTSDSYSALASAIKAAQEFLSSGGANATSEEAASLGAAITSAKDALVPLADFTAIDAKIAELEALASADYTAESWKALQDAITAAKALKDAKASQDEADKALASLEAAAKALVTAAKESATNTSDDSAESGCGGVIGATAVVIAAVVGLGAVALRKKDN